MGARRAAAGVAAAARALRQAGGTIDAPASAFFVPGRIEVLGKHTDYAGGRSLLAAMEFGFSVVAVPAPGREVRILDVERGRELVFPLEGAAGPARPGWERYPRIVLDRMLRDAPSLRESEGALVAFSGSLPQAAGMSSSSALVVALFLALADRWGLEVREGGLAQGPALLPRRGPDARSTPESRVRLADYLAAVETGVGTAGGSEDHTAILCARPGMLLQARFRPTVLEAAVPMPPEACFALASSGVVAEKAGAARAAYNRLSAEADEIARAWRGATGRREPHLGAILALGPGASARLERLCRDEQRARLEQFREECEALIPEAGRALAAEELERFADRVARSQALAEEVLGNQVDETRALVRIARELGAPAASAFGAGFGGSVWALVPEAGLEAFLGRWHERYVERFPERAEACRFIGTCAGPAALRIA